MKKHIALQFFCFLFSSIFGSLEEKMDSDWFEKCLKKTTGVDRCIQFDNMTTMAFLTEHKNTASFSPLCSDMNVLVQCCENDFGPEFVSKGSNNLKFVTNSIKNTDPSLFKTLNCFYGKGKILQSDITAEGYLFKIYPISLVKQIFSEHAEWVKTESQGLFETPLHESSFDVSDRIYVSMIYFKDEWAKKFYVKDSYDDEFKLYNGLKILRRFMTKTSFYKYAYVGNMELEFQLVAIPYKEKGGHGFKRYMIYLIPSKHDISLPKLWNEFNTFSEGKIKNLISNLSEQEIELHIPKVEHLKSKFELTSLLRDVFKYQTSFSCNSTMVTYISVDENGTEAAALTGTTCVDGISRIPFVAATRPYISFVFDMHSERILFITKDTGTFEN